MWWLLFIWMCFNQYCFDPVCISILLSLYWISFKLFYYVLYLFYWYGPEDVFKIVFLFLFPHITFLGSVACNRASGIQKLEATFWSTSTFIATGWKTLNNYSFFGSHASSLREFLLWLKALQEAEAKYSLESRGIRCLFRAELVKQDISVNEEWLFFPFQ